MAAKTKAFSIRLATIDDADALWQLVQGMTKKQRVSQYFGNDASQLIKDLSGSWIKCFIAVHLSDNKTIGFCIVSLPYSTWVGQSMQLSAIFVDPDYRGQHLCSALVTAAFRYAKDVVKTTRVNSTVSESNIQAAKVLEHFGFYNLTLAERWMSYRLDSAGLRLALKSDLRPGIRLDGFGNVPGTPTAAYIVRPGHAIDCSSVLSLIKDLANFHGFADEVKLTADRLTKDLENDLLGCFVAVETSSMRIVGMTVAYCFFTIEYGMMVHIDDIFVQPQHRGMGLCKAMIVALCHWALNQGAVAIDLRVLSWNTNAQAVYSAIGFDDENVAHPVIDYRSDGEHFTKFFARCLPNGVDI